MIQIVQNQKDTNISGLTNLLQLRIGAKVRLTVKIDLQDRLISGQFVHIDIAQNTIQKLYAKFFDPLIGLKAMVTKPFMQVTLLDRD